MIYLFICDIIATERAKKEAIRSAGRVSNLLVDAVNSGVQEAFINEKRIELEIRALAATIARFMKQTDQWLAATHAINTAVKVQDHLFSFISFCILVFSIIKYVFIPIFGLHTSLLKSK